MFDNYNIMLYFYYNLYNLKNTMSNKFKTQDVIILTILTIQDMTFSALLRVDWWEFKSCQGYKM